MMYKVEHRFLYGWDDAGWTVNDKPARFASKAAAKREIAAHCKDTRAAVKRGDMSETDSVSDFRIVPA